jgi:hypothetical protein
MNPARPLSTLFFPLALACALSACDQKVTGELLPGDGDSQVLNVDFGQDASWVGGQSDYGPNTEPEDVVFERRDLPAPATGQGLYAAGTNRSDDVFLYIKRRVEGLRPNQRYAVSYRLRILTSAPAGCLGVGGSPGESVYLKAGASIAEPVAIEEDGYFRMNIDKGNQATAGPDALNLGNLAGTNADCANPVFEEKTLRSESPLDVSTGADGALWLLLGIDSGFEARSELYYRSAEIRLRPN